MADTRYAGVSGTVAVDDDTIVYLRAVAGGTGGTVKVGNDPTITIPANQTFEWSPKTQIYDASVVFTGTVSYFMECS